MDIEKITGLNTAVITPMFEDGSVNYDAIGVSFFGLFGFVQTWNLFVALVAGIPVGIAVSSLAKKRNKT